MTYLDIGSRSEHQIQSAQFAYYLSDDDLYFKRIPYMHDKDLRYDIFWSLTNLSPEWWGFVPALWRFW